MFVAVGIVPGNWKIQVNRIYIIMGHLCYALKKGKCLADINTGFAGCLNFHLLYPLTLR